MPAPTIPLTSDVPCRQCGYDLRGVAVDAECPECGMPVSASHGRLRVRGDVIFMLHDSVIPQRCIRTNEPMESDVHAPRTLRRMLMLYAFKASLPLAAVAVWLILWDHLLTIGLAMFVGLLMLLTAGAAVVGGLVHLTDNAKVCLSTAGWRDELRRVALRYRHLYITVAVFALMLTVMALAMSPSRITLGRLIAGSFLPMLAVASAYAGLLRPYRFEFHRDGYVTLHGCSAAYLQQCKAEFTGGEQHKVSTFTSPGTPVPWRETSEDHDSASMQHRSGFPCRTCGYDLRATALWDDCPECGTPVRASLPVMRVEDGALITQRKASLPARCIKTNQRVPETNGRRTYWLTFALVAAKCVLPILTITLWFIAAGAPEVSRLTAPLGSLILAAGAYAHFASWHETTTIYLSAAAWRNAYYEVLRRNHLRAALVAGVALLIGGWAMTLNHHVTHWDQWLSFALFVPMAAMTYLVSRVKLYRFEQRDDGLIALFGCGDEYLRTCIEENNRRMGEATGAAETSQGEITSGV